jgi:hypothetical protein
VHLPQSLTLPDGSLSGGSLPGGTTAPVGNAAGFDNAVSLPAAPAAAAPSPGLRALVPGQPLLPGGQLGPSPYPPAGAQPMAGQPAGHATSMMDASAQPGADAWNAAGGGYPPAGAGMGAPVMGGATPMSGLVGGHPGAGLPLRADPGAWLGHDVSAGVVGRVEPSAAGPLPGAASPAPMPGPGSAPAPTPMAARHGGAPAAHGPTPHVHDAAQAHGGAPHSHGWQHQAGQPGHPGHPDHAAHGAGHVRADDPAIGRHARHPHPNDGGHHG